MNPRRWFLVLAATLLGSVGGCFRPPNAAAGAAASPAPKASPAAVPAAKAKRAVIFVVESFSAGDVDRVELKTFKALQAAGTYYKECYTCPPTRIRKDKKFGTVVPNVALVTGTVFWSRAEPFHTLGEAVKGLGNSMNLAKYDSYDCINNGFTHSNTTAGSGAKFFETAKALYKQAQPVVSIIHPQDPGDGKTIRDNVTSPQGDHLRELVAVDQRIGEFIAMLKAAGDWDSTLLVITSDHGIVDATSDANDPHPPTDPISWKVPLLLAGPGIKAGQTFEYSEQIDLPPTVCRLLGVAPPTGSVGRVLGEALVEPGNAPTAPKRQYMKEWMEQIVAFAKTGKDEKAAGFFGPKRFLEWGLAKTLDALLDQNAKALK